jgi:hypothetical protein
MGIDTGFLASASKRVRDDYVAAVGRLREDLVASALVLDIGVARRNIAVMDATTRMPAGIKAGH